MKLCLEFKFCGFEIISSEDIALFIFFTKPQVLIFIFFCSQAFQGYLCCYLNKVHFLKEN